MSAANNFTLLRLILAILVAFQHFRMLPTMNGIAPFSVFGYGDFAIDAFFIVSGFLVSASFDSLPHTGAFYIKRLFRIYPLYAAVVILQGCAMVELLPGGIAAHGGELLRYLGPNLVFANFLQYDVGGLLGSLPNPGINPSLWTLKIELGFYVLLPFLWRATQRYGVVVLITLYAASTLYAEWCLHNGLLTLSKQLPGQLRFFAVGMVLYMYRDRMRMPAPAAIAATIALFVICSAARYLPVLAIYPLLMGAFVFVFALRIPAAPVKRDISYGVYLMHGPLIQFSLLLGLYRDHLWFLGGLLIITGTLALLARVGIEKPCILLGRKLAHALAGRSQSGMGVLPESQPAGPP